MKKYWYLFIQKILPSTLAFIGKKILQLLIKTCTLEVEQSEGFVHCALHNKCIVMLWHNRLVLAPTILYKYGRQFNFGVLVSKSRDGEIIASIINSYEIASCIRVAHNAKKNALDEALNYINERKGILVITPDGPKGPAYRIKKGTAYLAKVTGAEIVPLSWRASRYWQLDTWDKMQIPKPFSKIKIFFGDPFKVEGDKELTLEAASTLIEERMQSMAPFAVSNLNN